MVQDDVYRGKGTFLISNPTTQAIQRPNLQPSSIVPIPPDERTNRIIVSRNDAPRRGDMVDMSMVDPALTRPAYPPISTFQETLPREFDSQDQQPPQSFELYQFSAPLTPLSAQSPGLSIFAHLQVADDSGSPIAANRNGLANNDSPLSTPLFLGSDYGTPSTESPILDRPAKRPRYEGSLYTSRILPPLIPNSDSIDEHRSAMAALSQADTVLIRGGGVSKAKSIPTRENSRRLSVGSLLSGPLEGTSSEQHNNGREWDYQTQDWTPYMHDVYQDTETWGVDRGLVDLDVGKNDDANAISESCLAFNSTRQEFDVDNGGESSPIEFGFGMENNETALDVGYYDKPVSISIPRALRPLPAKLLENPMNLLVSVSDLDFNPPLTFI